jgi:tight adherence protein B
VPAVVIVTAVLLAASALVCWPGTPGRGRLRALAPGSPARWSWSRCSSRLPAARPEFLAAGAGLASAPIGGVGGALAVATVAGLVSHRWRTARRVRRCAVEQAELVDAVGLLVAELRVGAHPAAAAAAAASTGDEAVHRVLRSVAAGARLGAPVPVLLNRHAAAEPAIADGLARLASAWEVADRHGVALAELVEAVRVDLDARLRIGGELRAQLAGPRATAAILAGLPVLGVLLGEGIGAGPLRVLTQTGIGQVLLVVGTALACAGTAWSDRIMASAVRT